MNVPYLQAWAMTEEVPHWRPGEVHVWTTGLDVAPETLCAFEQLLSDDERERARRFVLNDARRRFIATRGQLRQLLGRYLRHDPRGLHIGYGPYGKPHLDDVVAGTVAPRFNVTHCGDFALYALSFERDVGVDLACVDETHDIEALGQYFLTIDEQAVLAVLPPRQRRLAYFRHWARKEAYVKARGYGLRLDPRSFCTLVNADQCVQLDDTGDAARPPLVWTIRDLAVGSPYVGAVAASGGDWQPVCWSYAAGDTTSLVY